jgi:5-oxoprolinase (ATP-hydrolysing)
MALVITKGFRDLLHIGNQSRPNLFDLTNEVPDVLYECVVEVDERVVLQQVSCQLHLDTSSLTGLTGERVHVVQQLNRHKLRKDLQDVLDRGICGLAVCCAHSYTYSSHEEAIGELAREMGFSHVSLSSQVMPMVRMVPRGYTG